MDVDRVDRLLYITVITIFSLLDNVGARGGSCTFQCPRPGDPDDYTVCCTTNGVSKCCSYKLLAGILGGVFGALALLGIIIGVVCCVKIKKGDWVCLQVRPGKYTMVTRAKYDQYTAQRHQAIAQQQQMTDRMTQLNDIQSVQQKQIDEQNREIADLRSQLNCGPPPYESGSGQHM